MNLCGSCRTPHAKGLSKCPNVIFFFFFKKPTCANIVEIAKWEVAGAFTVCKIS